MPRTGLDDRRQKPIVCPTEFANYSSRGMKQQWDRPSPCAVCHASHRIGRQTTKTDRLSHGVCKLLVARDETAVGQTIALRGLSCLAPDWTTDDKNRSSVPRGLQTTRRAG